MVPDDAESCPSCGQDLSSLRALLKDFYSDEPVRPDEQDLTVREPEVFPVKEEKPPLLPAEQVHEDIREDIRIVTGPYPEYDQKLSLHDALSREEPEEEEGKPSIWDPTPRGGFWLRLMALAMDSLILLLLVAIFLVLGFLSLSMGAIGERGISLFRQVWIVFPIILPLGFVLMLSYFTFFHGTWGQTIGKMVFSLRVVRTAGQSLTFSRAFVRALGYWLSAFPFFLGFFWVGFTSSKRSWHDAIADTMVIRER
jgi:uncharacterized RDD family membrane protein YckC